MAQLKHHHHHQQHQEQSPSDFPERALEAEKDIDGWITDFLQDWWIASVGAVSAAYTPPEQEGKDYFSEVLATNLSWALAGIITADPELVPVALIATAFEALVGGNEYYGPSGKDLVIKALAHARQETEKELAKARSSWALDVLTLRGGNRPADLKTQQKYIWGKIFRTPYDNHLDVLQTIMLGRINYALTDFRRQYREWGKRIQKCFEERTMSPVTSTPEWWKNMDYCKQADPFKPELHFQPGDS